MELLIIVQCSYSLDETSAKRIIWQTLQGVNYCHHQNVSESHFYSKHWIFFSYSVSIVMSSLRISSLQGMELLNFAILALLVSSVRHW